MQTNTPLAPEAGSWFQEYFEMLIENANPPFEKSECKPKKPGKGKPGKGEKPGKGKKEETA